MADNKTQFKINKLAKDLGLKSKDLCDMLAKRGKEVAVQKSLEPAEFDILFDSLTGEHQISDIGDYLDGKSYIPSKKKPAKKKEEAKPKAEPAEAPKTEAKAEPKPEEKAKAESKTEAKPAAPEAKKPAAAKAPEAAREVKEVKAPKTVAKAPETPKAPVAKAPETAAKAPVAPKAAAVPSPAPVKAADAPKAAPAPTPKQPEAAKPAAPTTTQAPAAQRPASPAGNTGYRPQNGNPMQRTQTPAAGYGASRPTGGAQTGARSYSSAPSGTRQYGQSGGYQPRPQTGTYGAQQGRTGGYGANGGNGTSGSYGQRPAGGTYGQRPNGGAFGGSGFGGQRPSGGSFGGGSGFGGQRPAGGNGNRGGSKNGRGGRFGGDKGDYIPSGPRETFKAQPIVRGASTNVNPDGTLKGPRVVNTRGTEGNVDLSKYDEKLDTFVSDREQSNLRGGKQQVKKAPQQQTGPQGKGAGRANGRQAFGKNAKGGKRPAQMQSPIIKRPTSIELPDDILVSQLASKLMVTAGEVVKKLFMMGMMVTVNQSIDFDTAALVADEFGVEATHEVVVSIEDRLFDDAQDVEEQLVPRAPVVCVMGHVDHGKTSILDAIRNTHVTAGEAGGITQHIGAYRVKVKGREITFLDTPGHEAFTAMRARGAMATDIAILVVAADDGVMPQTVEAINHAKAAGIDIVVAINKMDKPGANPDSIKTELTKYGLVPEEWGGDVICVPVSALKHEGIDDLLESVLLVADMKELKANPNRRAKGIVIEAKLDKGKGPVATVLVQNGTLHGGDIIIAGTAVGRVRSMMDHTGKMLKDAGPSVPVEITGLAEVPSSGDEFQAVEDERMARTLADQRRAQAKEDVFKANARANLNDLFAQISEGIKTLNIIVKADVGGSAEAVKQSLEKLSCDEVKVHVIHAAAGGITEGDVTLAAASDAIIVGFNVRPDKAALDSAERQKVDIRTYRVIYECIGEIEAAMKGMLAPKFKEVLLGHAEVRQTIHVPNVGTIAGCYVQDGKITRQSQIRVLRDSVVIFEDKISSLRRFKDDVKEVASGYECGVGVEKFNDIKVGDVLEAYIMEQIQV
ncbi:MAG TPA: translation initiation factor IF-2 [Clostridiales bacterium]|nr:translation initiation factor IF-2 [Clostridiales bacterium]